MTGCKPGLGFNVLVLELNTNANKVSISSKLKGVRKKAHVAGVVTMIIRCREWAKLSIGNMEQ